MRLSVLRQTVNCGIISARKATTPERKRHKEQK
jgi:uncharacterized DUF497 family protein